MVLKTGPDRPVRPVQPWTGLYTGPVMWKIRKLKKNQQKPVTGGLIGITGDRNDWIGYEADQNERENITPAAHDFGFLSIPASRRCSPTTPASRRCSPTTLASCRRRISAKHQIRSSCYGERCFVYWWLFWSDQMLWKRKKLKGGWTDLGNVVAGLNNYYLGFCRGTRVINVLEVQKSWIFHLTSFIIFWSLFNLYPVKKALIRNKFIDF